MVYGGTACALELFLTYAISTDKVLAFSRCHRHLAMLINRDREKLCNAIVYFAKRTEKLGKTKLFKLLFFLDFEHFKLTGRSVTGLQYSAWPMGPVPKDLFDEYDSPGEDLARCVEFRDVRTKNVAMKKVVALTEFDPKSFSKRELALMERLAGEYRAATAEEMIEATHLENRPWHQVYEVENKRQQKIPYELALNRQETEQMLQQIRERKEVLDNYKK